ncbi:hypothetical protein C2U27_20325 [Bacillus aerophilus]|nr:hypothetical protein [Bacillus aerophilus]
MNAVFLSNEIQPFPLEPSDRRFMVVWPQDTLSEDLQYLVGLELEEGGAAAFFQYLLDYDTRGFTRHSKPMPTVAKQRLIDFSLPNFEVFWQEWSSGELEAPFTPCLSRDLYRVYCSWCRETGNKPLTETKLSTIYGSRMTKARKKYRLDWDQKIGTFLIPESSYCPEGTHEIDWLGNAVSEFRRRTSSGSEGDA